MSAEPVPRSAALRAALADVSDVVERVAAALDDRADGAPVTDDLHERVLEPFDALMAAASDAVDHLLQQKAHAAWDAQFGDDRWPERRAALLRQLADDADVGTAVWFESWLEALTSGANQEAWRILKLPEAVADWATWLPDRAAAVQSAVEQASIDAEGAVGQLRNLIEVLLDYDSHSADHTVYGALDRLTRDAVKGRIELLLIVARVLALAGDARADDLCQQANRLLGSVRAGDEATIGLSISATESFIWRHGPRDGTSSAVQTLRAGGAMDLAGIHEFVQLQRSAESTQLPAAPAAWLQTDGYAPPPSAPATQTPAVPDDDAAPQSSTASTHASVRPALSEVQQLVDQLPTVAGTAEHLAAILEPPADVLVVALATRLLAEDRSETAAALLEGLWLPGLAGELRDSADRLVVDIGTRLQAEGHADQASSIVNLLWIPDLAVELREPAVRLRMAVIEMQDLDAETRASSYASIGDQAIWGGLNERGRECYERALELAPGDPKVERGLANALYMSAGLRDEWREHDDLIRALQLCEAAAAADPVSGESSWVHMLTRLLHQRLFVIEKPPPSSRLWEALRDAIASYAADTSRDPQLWRNVVFDLRNVGLLHTGYRVSTRFAESGDDGSTWEVVYSLLNTGRAAEALELMPTRPEENEREGWRDAVRGYALAWLDRDDAAAILAAVSETGNVFYIEWLAEFQTRRGDERAATAWEAVRNGANLDDPDEANLAVCAAVYQGRFEDARAMAQGVRSGERLQLGWQCGRWAVGIADIIDTQGRHGWDDLTAAMSGIAVLGEVDRLRLLTRAILKMHGGDRARDHLARLDAIAEAVEARVAKAIPLDDPEAAMLAELAYARAWLDDGLVSQVIDEFTRYVVQGQTGSTSEPQQTTVDGSGAASSPEVEEVPEPPVGAIVPPSWLADWEGRELESELFVTAIPLARAALSRRDVAQRRLEFASDESCEPNLILVSPSGFTEVGDTITIDQIEGPSAWYCPEAWLPSLSAERLRRATPVGATLYRVPDPVDATERVSSWSAWEAVARAVFDVVEMSARGASDAARAKYSSSAPPADAE